MSCFGSCLPYEVFINNLLIYVSQRLRSLRLNLRGSEEAKEIDHCHLLP